MKLIRFFSRQRALKLERPLLRRVTRYLLEELLDCTDYELAFHFIRADEMAKLNETFLGHEGSTDVITFDHRETSGETTNASHSQAKNVCGKLKASSPRPFPPQVCGGEGEGAPLGIQGSKIAQVPPNCKNLSGEIFISVDDALAYARQYRVRWPSEITRYIVHGILHLEGFDDLAPAARRAMKSRENKLLKELSARLDLSRMGKTLR